MQLDEDQLLFYLDALYEFANEVSKRRSVQEILKGMLSFVTGTFGITEGMVLVCYAGEATFELVAHQNLDSTAIEKISRQLHRDIQDDLAEASGLVNLSLPLQLPATPATLRELMASVGMGMVTAIRIQEQMTTYVGLGQLPLDVSLSERQSKLLSAFATHTAVALENALFCQSILQENQLLKQSLQKQYQFDNIVGQSAQMQEIYQRVQQVAEYPSYLVLISGESGTGKELIARAVHHHSSRKDRMFLAINCGALPRELVESELYGYERGAFTGATTTKPGLFEVAEGGTLFLDEIVEMPTATQAKLLRTLEQKEVMRIGGSTVRSVDVRVIASTNRDVRKAIAEGQLREDLFYRFDVQIHMPPLRDKKEDIPLLVDAFLEEIGRENQQAVRAMSPQGLKALMDYDWPGNVRELKKILMQAVMVTEGTIIQPGDIPLPHDEVHTVAQAGFSLRGSVERLKRMMIEQALDDCHGNKTKAAAQLGMTRQNLQNTMRRMNMT